MKDLNKREIPSTRRTNSSIGWLGVHALLFCAFENRALEQLLPDAKVEDLVHQTNVLQKLKKLGTLTSYPCPPPGNHDLSVLVYSDAGCQCEAAQLSFLIGIIGPFNKRSVFHTIGWHSHK